MPNTYKAKILQKIKESPIDALHDFDVEADASPTELDPAATAEGDEAGENMVNNLLDESQEDDGAQSKANERMKQIDDECREEAQRDEKLLRQRIEDQIKQDGVLDPAVTTNSLENDRPIVQQKNKDFIYMRKEPVKNSTASAGVALLSDDSEGGNSRA